MFEFLIKQIREERRVGEVFCRTTWRLILRLFTYTIKSHVANRLLFKGNPLTYLFLESLFSVLFILKGIRIETTLGRQETGTSPK